MDVQRSSDDLNGMTLRFWSREAYASAGERLTPPTEAGSKRKINPVRGGAFSHGWAASFRAGMGWMLLGLLSACTTGDDGFGDDPSTPIEDSEEVTCAPVISELSFARGSSETLGSFIRTGFSYRLGQCGGKISSATVRVHIVNVDAPDPDAPEASAWYDLPTDSSYISLDTDLKTLTVDFSIPDETTTYEFTLKLIDSMGYASNKLIEEVVYQEITEEL